MRHDPTDVEWQLESLRRERNDLKSVLELCRCALDAAASHFMITDATRGPPQIVYVNQALARDHGCEREELMGHSPEVLVAMEETDAQGQITHFMCIGADITERLEEKRKQEELLQQAERMAAELRMAQKLEAVSQLAAGIAHEINTPIQYVGDSVNFLRQAACDCNDLITAYQEGLRSLASGTALTEIMQVLGKKKTSCDLPFLRDEVPKAFGGTLDGVARVTEIVRAIKEFAHPDAVEESEAGLVHALETTLTVASNEYNCVATVETAIATLPPVRCNVDELNQVFLNLIVNATHAIEAAGQHNLTGRISVATAVSGDLVAITVGDNGCGIPKEIWNRIFDPFFTTKEVGKGAGQGLAIARSIVVDKHGGSLEVESEVGVGTRFTVRLPVAGRPSGLVRS